MAVIVDTPDPQGLLDSIYAEIDDGKIETWAYDEDGDFSHVTADGQWEGQAWLRPAILGQTLTFGILAPKGFAVSREAYGVYHGRFVEMLLAHFDEDFSVACATAQATDSDQI